MFGFITNMLDVNFGQCRQWSQHKAFAAARKAKARWPGSAQVFTVHNRHALWRTSHPPLRGSLLLAASTGAEWASTRSSAYAGENVLWPWCGKPSLLA